MIINALIIIISSILTSIAVGFIEASALKYIFPHAQESLYYTKILIIYAIWGALAGGAAWIMFGSLLKKVRHHLPIIFFAFHLSFALSCFMYIQYYDWHLKMELPLTALALFLVTTLIMTLYKKIYPRYVSIGWLLPILTLISIIYLLPTINQQKVNASAEISNNTMNTKAAQDRPNVLYILLDAADHKHISGFGYERKTTPFLDSIMGEMISNREFHSYPHGSTPGSTAALFTGKKYPSKGLLKFMYILDAENFTLSEFFKSMNYETLGYSFTYLIDAPFGYTQGFDSFYNYESIQPSGLCHLKRVLWHVYQFNFPFRDQMATVEDFLRQNFRMKKQSFESEGKDTTETTPRALFPDEILIDRFFNDIRKERDNNFFAYLHLSGPHAPYTRCPEKYHRLFMPKDSQQKRFNRAEDAELTSENLEILRAQYDGKLRWTDDLLKSIYERLKSMEQLDNTILMIASDHGYAFGQVSRKLMRPAEVINHPILFIRFPKRLKQDIFLNEEVHPWDILPTFADYFGRGDEFGSGQGYGESFLSLIRK